MSVDLSHIKTNGIGVPQVEDTKICVVMVGLPARGKSLIAGKGVKIIIHSGIHVLKADRIPVT